MKKLLAFIGVLVVLGCISLQAYGSDYRKPVVLVNSFEYYSPVYRDDAVTYKSRFMAALSGSSRYRVIDIKEEESLSNEMKRRLQENAIDDELVRNEEMIQLGANYIMNVVLSKLAFEQKKRETKKKQKDGSYTTQIKYYYIASFIVNVKLISCQTGTVIYSQSFRELSSGDTQQEARNNVFDSKVSIPCELAETIAPLSGIVIDQDYVVEKDKMKSCYIDLGGLHGIQEGDYFDIKEPKYVAGRVVYKKVGSLKVTSVLADDISECKVHKDGKDVLKAMKECLRLKTIEPEKAQPLVIESRCEHTIWPF